MFTHSFWRYASVMVMWIVLGAVAVVALSNSTLTTNIDATAITISCMIIAMLGTIAAFVSEAEGGKSSAGSASGKALNSKTKRGAEADDNAKLSMLMDLMSEAEREEFMRRLQDRIIDEAYVSEDGEINYRGSSLNKLIDR